MFWADKIAKTIIDSGKYLPYWVDDMKTPSGRIHVGSLRGVVIHDLVYKALVSAGQAATFTYVFEDHDPMDGLPVYLDQEKWKKFLGQPLFTVPSPGENAQNFGEFFALEFQKVFNQIGCQPKIIWMSEMYKAGKLNDSVRLCLDKASEIRKIYEEMYEKKLPATWYPFQVVCPKCGKESTTRVSDWDGEQVTFTCMVDAVDWTKGCGYTGKISPFSDSQHFAGKLPWKVEWPVKWQMIGVTVEGAGKDHMSAGGSHDVAKQICKRVLNYPVPYSIGYEFFLLGGKKMSSSKGVGSSAKEAAEILPPYLLRFIFTRTDYNQAIDFNPVGTMAIPDLFDEYDRARRAFITNRDENLARAFTLSQIETVPSHKPIFLPRFRDIVNFLQQPSVVLTDKFAESKGASLTKEELALLEERIAYARIWLEKYAPAEFKFTMSAEVPLEAKSLSATQKSYLEKIIPLLEQTKTPDELQLQLYAVAKELQLNPKQAFAAIYLSLLGKTHGPKAAWFLLQYPKKEVVKRLQELTNNDE